MHTPRTYKLTGPRAPRPHKSATVISIGDAVTCQFYHDMQRRFDAKTFTATVVDIRVRERSTTYQVIRNTGGLPETLSRKEIRNVIGELKTI